MSFFDLSDGQKAESTTEAEMGGGNFAPIPSNTQLASAIEESKWDSSDRDGEFISCKWTVLEGEYENRKVFQKIKVKDQDSKTRDKAMKMLAAIDANCGGKLVAAGKEPTDMDLAQNLLMKPMVIMVQVWELETEQGEKINGNWVNKVSSLANGKPDATPAPANKANDFDDDIPF